jgi:hypothetical protein
MFYKKHLQIFTLGFMVLGCTLSFGQSKEINLITPPLDGTKDNPISVSSPVVVEWQRSDTEKDKFLLVQVYNGFDKKPVFPGKNPHKTSSCGVKIHLGPGEYEVKVSRPGTKINVSTWVQIE